MAVAGRGADEQARRARVRAARLRQDLTAAELRRQLAAAQRAEHAWSTGAEGERLVAETLTQLDGWRVLHDVHWPGRRYANVDHIAVGPGGVVVIDTKNWSQAAVTKGVLRSGGYRKDRELTAVASAVAAVTAVLRPEHRSTVVGVLCLVQQDVSPARTPQGVTITGRSWLVRHLRSLEPRLTPAEVAAATDHLRTALDDERSPASSTTADVSPAAQESAASRRRPVSRRPAQRPPRTRRTSGRRPATGRPLLPQLLRVLLALGVAWFALTVGPTWAMSLLQTALTSP